KSQARLVLKRALGNELTDEELWEPCSGEDADVSDEYVAAWIEGPQKFYEADHRPPHPATRVSDTPVPLSGRLCKLHHVLPSRRLDPTQLLHPVRDPLNRLAEPGDGELSIAGGDVARRARAACSASAAALRAASSAA